MDEKRNTIQELEKKKKADIDARNSLLKGLGEALFQRIGEGEPFSQDTGDSPGILLAEYRGLLKEIAESADLIKNLEADIVRLKELEGEISTNESEYTRLAKELVELNIKLGKELLGIPGFDDRAVYSKQQEEILLAKIAELERKLEALDEREGGILAWLGKNAQIAVSRALLLKNRSTLERVYRSIGEKILNAEAKAESGTSEAVQQDGSSSTEVLKGEAAGLLVEARRHKEQISSLNAELSMLRGQRREIGGIFAEGSPAQRIQGLEKRIAFVKQDFPSLYLRFGTLATESSGKEALSSFLKEEDDLVLQNTENLKSRIGETELEIEKIKAAISIEGEKAEIEKMKKAIAGQQQKITSAEEAINGLEKQIAESEKHIEELNAFIQGDAAGKNE